MWKEAAHIVAVATKVLVNHYSEDGFWEQAEEDKPFAVMFNSMLVKDFATIYEWLKLNADSSTEHQVCLFGELTSQ